MTNLFRLSTLFLFLISFSGIPREKNVAAKVQAHAGYQFIRLEDDEFIPWKSDRRLLWDDFLCAPKTGSDAVASTSTTLGIAYQLKQNQFEYQVTCNFSKIKSWGLLKTPYILAHEQAHFDITEIFARKLHKELSEYQFNKKSFKQDINRIYKKIVSEKEAFQKAYDGQTDHSRNRRLQYEWLEKIDEILLETEIYSNYP